MIKKLDWSHGNIVAYEASGILTKEENEQILKEMCTIISKFGKVRLYIRLPSMAFPELRAMGIRFKFAKKHIKHIERYTVVSDSMFIKAMSHFARLMPSLHFRYFTLDQEKNAREWIETNHVRWKPDALLIAALTGLTITVILLMIRSCRALVIGLDSIKPDGTVTP